MTRALLFAALGTAFALLFGPSRVLAHGLTGRYESPLPLAVYLAGAAAAVAVSFLIAFRSRRHWRPSAPAATRRVPRLLILGLKLVGFLAWAWIMAQLWVGGSSDAEVDTLFTWVYGWVGVAIVCAIVGPVWSWLDPFSTIFDAGAWVARRIGLSGWRTSTYPPALASWPAALGFLVFVWLELVYVRANMGVVVAAYTLITLAAMFLFGKEAWRRNGEVFSVWFGLLGRLARFTPAGSPESGLVRPQHALDGLLERPWDVSLLSLTGFATGAILFDGLSQTQVFFDIFGAPVVGPYTLWLLGFLGIIVGLAFLVARQIGYAAMGAGLLPISLGYLIAHYLTYLLSDGQRIIIAISDPLQLGWDLFDTAFFEPSIAWLPPALLWGIIFVSVVGGHMVGAWAGHIGAEVVASDQTSVQTARARNGRARLAQLPLAAIMVVLTTLTLWSLGQAVVSAPAAVAGTEQPSVSGAASSQGNN